MFTAKHEQAARLLIQHMRLFVRAHRLRRGVQIRHHTKLELEEIDRRLVEEFKRMHEREAGILRPEDLQEAQAPQLEGGPPLIASPLRREHALEEKTDSVIFREELDNVSENIDETI